MIREYKILENPPSKDAAEKILNDLGTEGWRVVEFGQFQICLEREKNEEQEAQRIEG